MKGARTFIALNPEASVLGELGRWQVEIRREIEVRCPGQFPARWTRADQFHLTVEFLGDLDSKKREAVILRMNEVAAETRVAPLQIGGFGWFPVYRLPRVLWLGVLPSAPLIEFQQKLRLSLAGVCEVDKVGSYFPHLTIARLSRVAGAETMDPASRGFLDELRARFANRVLEWPLGSVSLMESRPGQGGTVFSSIATARFGAH